jgi:hypothetical protein
LRLFRENPDDSSLAETWLFQLRARDRWQDAVGYLLHRELAPDQFDRASLPLPPSLAFLHYLWRPLRRLGRHGQRWLRSLFRRGAPPWLATLRRSVRDKNPSAKRR